MQDDNSLMELVKNGDKEAYSALVSKYRIPAISFAYSFLFNLTDAEDAVQESFINIYIKRESYQPIYSFRAFLFGAVRNKCIDYLRRAKIRAAIDIDSIAELSCRSAEESFIQSEREKTIFDIMSNLKADYKTALYLYAIEGASYSEIAQIMKKTMPQVKILIFRARKKLKGQYLEIFGNEK